MLTRICLIVAVVAGLAVAGLNFVKVREKITNLMTERDSEKFQKETAQTELASTKKNLDRTTKDLTAAKAEISGAQEERDKAVAESETQTKRANALAADLTKTKQDLGDAQSDLAAWKALGIGVEQIKTLQADFKQSQTDRLTLTEANRKSNLEIKKLNNRLAKYEEGTPVVQLPADLRGQVLVSDPKWDFVVLNVGQNQGVLEDGIMLVNRNGRLVAKVQVRSVQSDRSIANVLPEWKLGDVMEGDQVIP